MPSRARPCRECREPFAPLTIDQLECRDCGRRGRDVRLITRCQLTSPRQTVEQVALATGIPIARIHELARSGRLSAVPVGAARPAADDSRPAEEGSECRCAPGANGRCGFCRARLATRLAEATHAAKLDAKVAPRGMHNRPSDGRGRRS
jgi:hypothetical protein